MVEWTEEERSIIRSIFATLDYDDVGPKALSRHGITVLHGLDRAVKYMDNIKDTYAELSILHSEKLHVDPDNFRLLSDCLTIVVPKLKALSRSSWPCLHWEGSTTKPGSFLVNTHLKEI